MDFLALVRGAGQGQMPWLKAKLVCRAAFDQWQRLQRLDGATDICLAIGIPVDANQRTFCVGNHRINLRTAFNRIPKGDLYHQRGHGIHLRGSHFIFSGTGSMLDVPSGLHFNTRQRVSQEPASRP